MYLICKKASHHQILKNEKFRFVLSMLEISSNKMREESKKNKGPQAFIPK